MAEKTARKSAGFTLVELMIVVAIIGLLSAIAIPAFSRYIKRSRTAEAVGTLNKLWIGSLTYFEADHFQHVPGVGTVSLAKQFPGPAAEAIAGGGNDCCAHPGAKCPGADPGFNGDVWTALQFSIPDPYSFKPSYTSADVGSNSNFTAVATGNPDCDAIRSTFTRRGGVALNGEVTGGAFPEILNELE